MVVAAAAKKAPPPTGGKKSGSAVVELTDANFNALVMESTDHWLVEFYAPWCGHCKKLLPTWNEFADATERLNIGVVNCESDAGSDLCTAFAVTGYPRLLYIDGNMHHRFKGERTVFALQDFVFQGLFESKEVEKSAIPVSVKRSERQRPVGLLHNVGLLVQFFFKRLGLVEIPVEIQYIIFGIAIAIPFGIIQKKYFSDQPAEEEKAKTE